MHRFNRNEPIRFAVFRSRDEKSITVNSHKEVVPMGYVNSLEEFDGYVLMEYPNAIRKETFFSVRGEGSYYYSDGDYNIFYHEMFKLNTVK